MIQQVKQSITLPMDLRFAQVRALTFYSILALYSVPVLEVYSNMSMCVCVLVCECRRPIFANLVIYNDNQWGQNFKFKLVEQGLKI